MIIINQNKEQVHNFDKIDYIEILLSSDADGFKIVANYDNDYDLLGFYETEERAKEVLQEIINKYKDYDTLYQGNNEIAYLQKPKVYEMPEV